MKKTYTNPQLEVLRLTALDEVLTTDADTSVLVYDEGAYKWE